MISWRFHTALLAACLASAALVGTAGLAHAEGYSSKAGKSYKKGGPRVKAYSQRRGGYSYNQFDVINTYGDPQGRYGAARNLRDPSMTSLQTPGGPFDSGFFFDSAVTANGGNAPYMR
jgi:hypothetical protein